MKQKKGNLKKIPLIQKKIKPALAGIQSML